MAASTKAALLVLVLWAAAAAAAPAFGTLHPATELKRILRALSPLTDFKRSPEADDSAYSSSNIYPYSSGGGHFYSGSSYAYPYSSSSGYPHGSGSGYPYSSVGAHSYNSGNIYPYSSGGGYFYSGSSYAYPYSPSSGYPHGSGSGYPHGSGSGYPHGSGSGYPYSSGSYSSSDYYDNSYSSSYISVSSSASAVDLPPDVVSSMAMFQQLLARGCGRQADELTDAYMEVMSSSIMKLLEGEDFDAPQREDVAMPYCALSNVESLQELSILTTHPLAQIQELYSCVVTIGNLYAAAVDPDEPSIGIIKAGYRYWEALRGAGLLDLE